MDWQIFELINRYAGYFEWLDLVGKFLATYAIYPLAILALSLWFLDLGVARKKNQYAVVLAIEAFVIGRLILTSFIQYFLPRLRPFAEQSVNTLINMDPGAAGFPSGHTVAAFAIALPVFIYNRKAGKWLMLLATLIAVSRIFVGVHYPSDVLAGFILSLIVVLVLNFFKASLVAPVVRLLRGE